MHANYCNATFEQYFMTFNTIGSHRNIEELCPQRVHSQTNQLVLSYPDVLFDNNALIFVAG